MKSHHDTIHLTGRAKAALETLLNRKQSDGWKLKEKSKSMLKMRAEELIRDLHEAKFILDEKEDEQHKIKLEALLTDKNKKSLLDILIFLGPNITITDQDIENLSEPVYPLLQKKRGSKGSAYTLYCENYSEDPVEVNEIILKNKPSVDCCNILFQDYQSGTLTTIILSVDTRFEMLEPLNIQIHKKGNFKSFYKFNSLLYGIGFLYLVDKNKCTIEDLKITEYESQNDSYCGFNKLLEVNDSVGVLAEKNNYKYFENSSKRGIYAAQYFTYTLRMSISILTESGFSPSPVELLAGQYDKVLFTELSKDNVIHTHNLKKSISKSLERNYAARAFEPYSVKNVIAYIRRTTPENKVTAVLDPCGGWGDRLVAFLTDKEIKKISINDANPNMIEPYEKIINKYNETKKDVELTCSPFEFYPEAQLIAKANSYDLVITSPPYFNKELYQGDQSSHKLYSDYSVWASSFLAKLIHNAYRMTNSNGYIVLCVANIKLNRTTIAMITDNTQSEIQRYCSNVFRVLYTHPNFIRNSLTPETYVIGKVNKQLPLLYQPSDPSAFPLISKVGHLKSRSSKNTKKTLKVSEDHPCLVQFVKLLESTKENCKEKYKELFGSSITTLFAPRKVRVVFSLLQDVFQVQSVEDIMDVLQTGIDPIFDNLVLLDLSALHKATLDHGLLFTKKLLAFVMASSLNNERNREIIQEFNSRVNSVVPSTHKRKSTATKKKDNSKCRKKSKDSVEDDKLTSLIATSFFSSTSQKLVDLPMMEFEDFEMLEPTESSEIFSITDCFAERVDALSSAPLLVPSTAEEDVDTFLMDKPIPKKLSSESMEPFPFEFKTSENTLENPTNPVFVLPLTRSTSLPNASQTLMSPLRQFSILPPATSISFVDDNHNSESLIKQKK